MTLRVKIAVGMLLALSIIPAAIIGYQAYQVNARRVATIELLRENLKNWQRVDEAYGRHVASRIQTTLEQLQSGVFSDFDTPHMYAAFISPAPAIYPEDAPILTLFWLESDFDADGFDLYAEGRLHTTVTGWKAECEADREALIKLHENTYDRYTYVDVPFRSSHKCDNNRDVVRLTQAQIQRNLKVQLRTDKPCGPQITVVVADSVVQNGSGQAAAPDITSR